MDEFVDILDEKGKYTGKKVLKSKAHSLGLFHPTVHIWFFTKRQQILIQQRSESKEMHPAFWDVSVAGHVAADEDILNAAQREVKEEIGLEIQKNDLIKVGIFKAMHTHGALQDNEFHHVFLCELTVPLHQLTLQKDEVADLKLLPLLTFAEETWGLANTGKYVSHGPNYYKTICKAIKKVC